MSKYEKIASDVFNILKGLGYQITIYDEMGKGPIIEYKDGKFFYVEPSKMMIILPRNKRDDQEVGIYKSKNLSQEELKNILKRIRNVVMLSMVGVTVRKFDKNIAPKDFALFAKKEVSNKSKLKEAFIIDPFSGEDKAKAIHFLQNSNYEWELKDNKIIILEPRNSLKGAMVLSHLKNMENVKFEIKESMEGSTRSSYQNFKEARVIVRHSKKINEELKGARSRNINSIFVEDKEGQRFKYPVNHLNGARALARHINEGGSFNDKIAEHIMEMSNELVTLKEFKDKFTDDSNFKDLTEKAHSRIESLKESCKKLQGSKGYKKYTESYKEERISKKAISEVAAKYRGMFTVESENDSKLIENYVNYLSKMEIRESLDNAEKIKKYMVDVLGPDVETKQIDSIADEIITKKTKIYPISKEIPKFKSKKVELSWKLSEFAANAKDDIVSILLMKVVDKLDQNKKLSNDDIDFVKALLECVKANAGKKDAVTEALEELEITVNEGKRRVSFNSNPSNYQWHPYDLEEDLSSYDLEVISDRADEAFDEFHSNDMDMTDEATVSDLKNDMIGYITSKLELDEINATEDQIKNIVEKKIAEKSKNG